MRTKRAETNLKKILMQEGITLRDFVVSKPSDLEKLWIKHGVASADAKRLFGEAKEMYLDQSVDRIMRWLAAPVRKKC